MNSYTTLHFHILFILFFQLKSNSATTTATNNCECSQKTITLDELNYTYSLLPTDTEFYCPNTTCTWVVEFSGSTADSCYGNIGNTGFLSENLLINTCTNNQSIYPFTYDRDQNYTTQFYTQENPICIYFIADHTLNYTNGLNQWSIDLTIIDLSHVEYNISLNKATPIVALNKVFMEYDVLTSFVSDSSGTIDIFISTTSYIITSSVYLYVYGALGSLTNIQSLVYIGYITVNGNNSFLLPTNQSAITILIAGKRLANAIFEIVFRIEEVHTKNCVTNNLILGGSFPASQSGNGYTHGRFQSNSQGSCHVAVVIPMENSWVNNWQAMTWVFNSLNYTGDGNVTVKYGFDFSTSELFQCNSTYDANIMASTMFTFSEIDAYLWNVENLYGILLTFIIPPNGQLEFAYRSDSVENNILSNSTRNFNRTIKDIVTVPVFTNPTGQSMTYQKSAVCISCIARYTVTIVSFNMLGYSKDDVFLKISSGNSYSRTYANMTISNETIIFEDKFLIIEIVGSNSWFSSNIYNIYDAQNIVRFEGEFVRSTEKKAGKSHIWIIIVGSVLVIIQGDIICEIESENLWDLVYLKLLTLSVFVIILSLIIYYRLRKKVKYFEGIVDVLQTQITPDDITRFRNKTDDMFVPTDRLSIYYDHLFGQGACSAIYKGHILGVSPFHKKAQLMETQRFADCDVAVKTARNMNDNEVEQLYKEIKVMKVLGYNENIMCMLGWSIAGDKPCLIFDIADDDLLNYVRKYRDAEKVDIPYRNFISFLWQIAKGMHYIASFGLVHRDLAARNILICSNNTAKIADFGLCSSVDENLTYQAVSSKRLPIKWLSLEALVDHLFSDKSDVWSFGVVMYEIFSYGKVPYIMVHNNELIEFLEKGGRLEQPDDMADVLYGVAKKCWIKDVQQRSNFEELEKFFHSFLERESEHYGYLVHQ